MLSLLRSKLRAIAQEDVTGRCCAEDLACFHEGRLSGSQRERVVSHLSLCEECRETLGLICLLDGSGASRSSVLVKVRWAWAVAASVVLVCVLARVIDRRPGGQAERQEDVAATKAMSDSNRTGHDLPPQVSVVSATAPIATNDVRWRVITSGGMSMLEVSQDEGRTWKGMAVPQFEPKSVAWKEPMVWVLDVHGHVMESGDNGVRWTRLH